MQETEGGAAVNGPARDHLTEALSEYVQWRRELQAARAQTSPTPPTSPAQSSPLQAQLHRWLQARASLQAARPQPAQPADLQPESPRLPDPCDHPPSDPVLRELRGWVLARKALAAS